jgi:hypothetical protein
MGTLEDGLSAGKTVFSSYTAQIPDSAPAKDPSLMLALND